MTIRQLVVMFFMEEFMVSDKALKVEVLAPAGSLDICKAVINAGADAVYLGGDMFGARAFAGNLNKEELIEAIEYAHTFGRKIYLTVNTLLKEDEINNQLIDYLIPYYEAGLDAVIVQDFGVFSLIRKHFPDMDIHASTQMTQTGPNGTRLLKEMGATRVVTSRELTIEEIRHLHNEVEDIEIESFVHGALCYCYSGQCLMSSFNGTRSGNRGRCAQPCRMAYQAYDRDVLCNDKSSEYVLSLKDMCALPILPDVIEAGVYSLKIEGRMKNVTYAAFVTSMYRKYVDMYIKNGRNGYRVSDDDIRSLMDIYNRGAFTTGYYNSDKGSDMISLSRPNHYGVPALKVLNNVNGRVTFRALIDINSQDVFEIDKDNSFASGSSVKKNETLVVNLPKKYPLFKGKVINRMNNSHLKTFVEDNYISVNPKVVLDMEVIAHINKPFEVLVKCEGQAYRYIGEEVGNAVKQPLTTETVEKNMSGLGDTFYTIGKLIVSMDDNIFLSVGQQKKARREAVSRLHQLRLDSYKRKYNKPYNNSDILRSDTTSFQSESKKCVYLKNTDFIDTVISCGANEIYLDYSLVINSLENVKKAVCTCKDNNVSVYIMLPYILSDDKLPVFCDLLNECEKLGIFGFVCRNLEEIGYISKWS